MFTDLPAEIRTLIYEFALVQDTPLLIEHSSSTRITTIKHEQPTGIKTDTRNWALLYTNRRISHEGACVLLSNSHFVYPLEPRPANTGCRFVSIELWKDGYPYLSHIRHISFAVMSDDWTGKNDTHTGVVGAMLLLRLFFTIGTRLRTLFIVRGSPGAEYVREQYTEMMNANVLVPLAVRAHVAGRVERVGAGVMRMVPAPEERALVTSGEHRWHQYSTWEPERIVHAIYLSSNAGAARSGKGVRSPRFVVFDSWYSLYPSEPFSVLRSGFSALRESSWAEDAARLTSADLASLGDFRAKRRRQRDTWHEETLLMDEFDVGSGAVVGVPACRVRFQYCVRQNWIRRTTTPGARYCISEYEYVSEVEMSREDFDDLRDAQAWWELWWAARVQGQREIDSWLLRP